MHNLVVMKVFEPLQDLFGVEDDGGFIVFKGTPLGAQQGRQASYRQEGRELKHTLKVTS